MARLAEPLAASAIHVLKSNRKLSRSKLMAKMQATMFRRHILLPSSLHACMPVHKQCTGTAPHARNKLCLMTAAIQRLLGLQTKQGMGQLFTTGQMQVPLLTGPETLMAYKTRSGSEPPPTIKAGYDKAQAVAAARKDLETAVAAGKPADMDLLASYMAYVKLEQVRPTCLKITPGRPAQYCSHFLDPMAPHALLTGSALEVAAGRGMHAFPGYPSQ